MSSEPLKPGGALTGRLFQGFLRELSDNREPKAGARIGPWRILEELGRGGSGVVFLAERADGAYCQQVAIKWLRADRPVPGGRAVLARERELLASLDHPGIARLIDGGEDDWGQAWFAMDHVAGSAIDDYAFERSLAERIKLIERLCRAVQHAHQRGLIHGDIKPGNVRVDEHGNPRLLDFGIARIKHASAASSRGLTPGYASPEQQRGELITTASDIWQLGGLLKAVTADLRLPPDLKAVFDKAMAEAPEQRHDSAAALAEDLAAWRTLRPVSAYTGGPLYRLARGFRRHLAAGLVATLAALLISGGGAWMTWQLAEERNLARAEAERATMALAETESALARADQLREFLIGLFRAAEADRPRDRLPDTATLLALGAERALHPASAKAEERLGMLTTLAEVFLSLGKLGRAGELLHAANQLIDEQTMDAPAEHARLLVLKGMAAMQAGDLTLAERWLEAAQLRAADQVRAVDEQMLALARRAWLEHMRGQSRQALDLLLPAQGQLAAGELVLRDSTKVHIYNTLATAGLAAGEVDEAVRWRAKTVELTRQLQGVDSRAHAIQLNNLAAVQLRLGQFEQAMDNLIEAIGLYDRMFQRPMVLRAAALGNQANVLFFTGQDAAALAVLRAAAAEWALAQGRDPGEDAFIDYQLGRFKLRMGREAAAIDALHRALARYAAQADPPLPAQHLSKIWLAHAKCRLDQSKDGVKQLSAIEQTDLQQHPDHEAEYHEAWAVCLAARNKPEAALVHIRSSLELADWPGYARLIEQRRQLKSQLLDSSGL